MYIKDTRSSWLKHLDFIIADILCIELSYVLAYQVRYWASSSNSFINYYRMIGIILPIVYLCIAFLTDCHTGVLRRGYFKEFKSVLKCNFLLFASALVVLYAMHVSAQFSRLMFLVFLVSSFILMYISRIALKSHLYQKRAKNKHLPNMLLVTKQSLAGQSVKNLKENSFSRFELRGIIITDADLKGSQIEGINVVSNASEMFDYVRTHVVDQVFIDVYPNWDKVEDAARKFSQMGSTVHLNLDLTAGELPNAHIEVINNFTVLTTCVNTISSRELFFKKLIDYSGGLVGLLATIIAFVIFAPIIYIQSPGPIFFSQPRVGKNGRIFKIYKFRTMYMDAEERKKELMSQNKMNGLMFKMDDDPRIFPIGKFLRKTSIDELPQSINILKGDMGLVGTRPPTLDEYKQYEMHHKKRLATKPGLTGMWQISGRSDITDFEEVVRLDTHYIENWSLGLYIKIILKTVGVVINRSGSM